MSKFGRILSRSLVIIAVIALILGAGIAYYFLRYLPVRAAPASFPQTDGEIRAEGLDAQVDIYRDQMGIPHIYASTPHDLFFAQGYVHAQDRFWQMDAWRHIGSGTLSEMFGKSQLETDIFLRTLGWRQTAEAEVESLDPESRGILLAYTEGVNAYLKEHKVSALSLEYAVLKLLSPKYQIEPWTPVNSLTWGKAMAWDLRGNMDEEIERAILLKTLTSQQVDELFPAYPEDHPVIVETMENMAANASSPGTAAAFDIPENTLATLAGNAAILNDLMGPATEGIGSNSWAVSGEKTTSGAPLLANDPHLGIQMPSIWYQVGMHCQPRSDACPYEMAGFSFAGVPGVVIGHNDRIAWGFTNNGPDVMDLYIERVNPENPNQYEVNGQWVDFETRDETIQFSSGKSVEVTVRATRHGPVVSDSYGALKDQGDPKDKEFVPFRESAGIDLPDDYVVALKWTALSPSTPFKAVWGFNKAQNWEDFRAAASEFHVPAQNLIYADVDGNIGYQMPGDIPIRASGDGRYPVPGWTDEFEWTGFIPFDELPYTFNPSQGFIVTANNQVHPRDYPFLVSLDWDYGFRANRILEMLQSPDGEIDSVYIQMMQHDAFDSNGPVYVPMIVEAFGAEESREEAGALELLKEWDFQAGADSPAAAVFEAFWSHLLRNTFNDDLPERYWPKGGSRWNEVMRNLKPASPWWDDRTTADIAETRDDILKKSFSEAVQELVKEYGNQPSEWRWGDMHTATFRNTTLGESGIGFIERLFNRGPFATGGGEAIVNATGWTATEGYEVDWLPSMRMIVDLGDLDRSLTVHTTGQSGHAYHPHYTDMIPLWAGNGYYPMRWESDSILKEAEGHLRLIP